jgi:hypothetical protein
MAITPNTTFVSGNVLTANQMNRLPWGVMGYAQATANQTGITTETNITGLSVTFTADSTRYYRTTLYVAYGEQQTSANYPVVSIADGSNNIKQSHTMYQLASQGDAFCVVVVETGLTGSTTRKGRARTPTGSLTLAAGATTPMFIVVEDIGQA